ncbi:MAG: hypothetical protein OQL06_12135 [Gammaproteobacteria bacterium]|nr:hypothetical protein [Gammaproteobacteria bacterium]
MNTFTRLYPVLTIALLAIPFSANAESWSCRHDNDVREIHIERDSSAPVPCRVVYKKLTEGVEDQVLWSANNDENYCDEKAREFVAKQESWGWTCVETISDRNSEEEATPAEETANES